ncbi:glutamate decarboxylase [Gordonia araii NBRC 100433]|uniref:Glutamate decarboxylase n=1 Tax=Gordonia araii NBRC 100433 TaxID=1073574 RepID=G7H5S2_9ACTN|nr:glutamate decarboxylase [Gordonia araii]NNG95907.1 glutamate decarboxylase [Gordonia araii NBRC 100433]GAB11197.1 glutamate decarboxylase [Gordonia araii NBRC 100433]
MVDHRRINESDRMYLSPVFLRPGEATSLARWEIADDMLAPETAYQIVHDEAMLDGNARLNLATFVSTFMDKHARDLYAETVDKNIIDKDEYPATAAIEERCWRIIGNLWNNPDIDNAIGTSTIGSSEACMLGGLALKRRWRERRVADGKPVDSPNVVLSTAVQVCWEKFCNYFEVEPRWVPVDADHLVMDGHDLENYVDENTIGVVAIMGQTFTGLFEPVKAIAEKLDEIHASTGLDLKIHVDAASGGMVAPFCHPDIEWDFRVDRVASINTSGHKYGLVYPGVGWIVWRSVADLPESMVFHCAYLGGNMPTLALNFSRPGAQVLLQYYQLLRLGRAGYTAVQQGALDVAQFLSSQIAALGPFDLVSKGDTIPAFAWKLKDGYTENWTLYDLEERLRLKGWQVPAYPMADNLADMTLQRIVVRFGLSHDLAESLLADIKTEVAFLDSLNSPMRREATGTHFHH